MWGENIEAECIGVEASEIGLRGWVVQERILSPRILHFAKDHVYWECDQQRFAEILPTYSLSRYPDMLRKSLPETEFETYHVWSETVRKYSRCDLTFCSDRLIAISALARRTCASLKFSPKDYLAGLWRPELDYELLWYTPSKIYDQEEMIPSCRVWDSDQVGAPSWSWASCNFHVLLPVRDPRNEIVNCLVVLEAETFFGNDPFGSLSGGRLLVQAPLHHIEHSKKPAGTIPEEPFFPGYGNSDRPSPIKIRWDHDWESIWDEKSYLKPKSLYCMCIQAGAGSVCALVLQPTGQGIGQFRRLGVFTLDMDTESKVERFLKESRNSLLIPDNMYKAHNPEKRFTIEIV